MRTKHADKQLDITRDNGHECIGQYDIKQIFRMFILHFYVYVEDALVVCGLSLQFPLQWRPN